MYVSNYGPKIKYLLITYLVQRNLKSLRFSIKCKPEIYGNCRTRT